MKPLPIVLAASLLASLSSVISAPAPSAPEPTAPPVIELQVGDPLLASLAERFPESFVAGTDRVVISIKPGAVDGPPELTRASPSPPVPAATVPPGLAALARFQGKRGQAENNVISATRAGNQPDIKVVALSPGDEGITVKGQPSLWWYQSMTSGNAEIEFILTEVAGRRPKELLRVPLRAMPQGFNSLNLANPALNPHQVTMKAGTPYQWTIAVRDTESSSAVFAKLGRVANPALEKSVLERPSDPATLKALSDSGNWYELFDTVSRLARRFPDNKDATTTRRTLLDQAGLADALPK